MVSSISTDFKKREANPINTSLNVIDVVLKQKEMQIKNHFTFSKVGSYTITQFLLFPHWTFQFHKLKLKSSLYSTVLCKSSVKFILSELGTAHDISVIFHLL